MIRNNAIKIAISEVIAQSRHLCTYGLGYLGKRLYREIPAILNLEPEYLCDGDDLKVDSTDLPVVKRIHRSELMVTDEPFLVLVLVDDPYDKEIKQALSVNENLYVLTLRELAQVDEVVEYFYGEELYAEYIALPDYGEIL